MRASEGVPAPDIMADDVDDGVVADYLGSVPGDTWEIAQEATGMLEAALGIFIEPQSPYDNLISGLEQAVTRRVVAAIASILDVDVEGLGWAVLEHLEAPDGPYPLAGVGIEGLKAFIAASSEPEP